MRHWLVELGRRHTLVRSDDRGCGLSAWDVADLSFETRVRDLETIADAARLDRFVMIGSSQAASLAIAYAARHPERVSRLVLHGGFCRGRTKRESSAQDLERTRLMLELIELGWGTDNAAFRQVFAAMFAPGGSAEQWRWHTETMSHGTSPRNAARLFVETGRMDVRELAPEVRCPTLVLHARGDALVPYSEGQLMAALIPGAEFVTLDSANHVTLEHEPAWQHLVAELRRFLQQPDAAGAADDTSSFSALSERERQVLELLAQGLGNEEIARRLSLSPRTVRNHVTSIFAKAEVTSRAQAIVRARDAGYGHGAALD